MPSLKDIRFKATFDAKGVITGLTQIDKKGKQVGKTLTNQFKKSSKSAGLLGSQLKSLFVGFFYDAFNPFSILENNGSNWSSFGKYCCKLNNSNITIYQVL